MEPRDYDREFRTALSGPLQIRTGLDLEKGEVTRFVVQLEYHHDGEWQPVVRYDHDGTGESEQAHDVTEEGVHIDIFREGAKEATEYVAPPRSGSRALTFAEEHLSKNFERFTTRYKRWHQLTDR